LLDRRKHAKNVQNGDLKTWLSAELYANFESTQREQTELRDEFASKLNEVVEYKRRLKLALFANSKAEGYSMRYKCITDAISALGRRLAVYATWSRHKAARAWTRHSIVCCSTWQGICISTWLRTVA
jgi:hypothetical protein